MTSATAVIAPWDAETLHSTCMGHPIIWQGIK
jgi:hypothetical protein